ncbi:MAG TPA: hypothetical protein VGS21_08240, partial [Acidimicrobiales bacterium]|nr:hypothetical protein [Acidimicrobiales bacterium]
MRDGVVARATAVPVPGDLYAPPGTAITFRGVTPAILRGLTVVGSVSGSHAGTIRTYPGPLTVFTPTRPFAGGERVVVRAPALDVTGTMGAPYEFGVARPASPSAAAAALWHLHGDEATTAGKAAGPVCPLATYRSAPSLNAQAVCMNEGVTTSGTEPGTDLFLTPGGDG